MIFIYFEKQFHLIFFVFFLQKQNADNNLNVNTENQKPFEFVKICKTPDEAVGDIPSNSSILVGGFGIKLK